MQPPYVTGLTVQHNVSHDKPLQSHTSHTASPEPRFTLTASVPCLSSAAFDGPAQSRAVLASAAPSAVVASEPHYMWLPAALHPQVALA